MSPNSQLHLTNDSFLYACQSEYAARSKKDGSFKSHIRYEPFLLGTFERPKYATLSDFAQTVTAITHHHFQVTPQFRRHEPLNLETVSYFTCSIATLFADLESACRQFFGRGLPVIPAEPPEYSAEAPLSKALLKAHNEYLDKAFTDGFSGDPFEAFPIKDVGSMTNNEQATVWSCEVWDTIADSIHAAFGEYADTAMGFAYWKYQEHEAKAEIDWRVRPPVGEAYAKAFKPMQRSARGDRGHGFDKGDRGGRDGRPPKKPFSGDKRPTQSASREAIAPPAPNFNAKPEEHSHEAHERKREQRPEREGREARPRHPDRDNRGKPQHRPERRDNGPGSVSSENQIEEALLEVQNAAALLKTNPNLKEIALKPNNSFIRRQQHSLAVELGLDTESRGEGKDRGVVLRAGSI